ncbi:MAG TPA: hypothetical protein VLA12_22575, partial [Planctomycetaceae bacterium]|nr:hypothetical protein [Planctomycetaceae bacterium]
MPKFPFIGYHGIRRFKQGRYYIRQSVEYRDGCLTILAGAMRKFDVGVSSYSFMSTHYHVAAHDLDFTIEVSRVGAFFQFLSSTLSKWLNHMRDTTGHIACPDMPFKPIGILDVESELRTDLYVELNPVTAGVVEHPRELNGLTSFREMLLEPLVIRRPEGWFDPKKWPEESQIQLSVPPRARAAGYSRKTWYLKTVALQETLRARIVAERKAAGKRTRSLEWARRQTPETTGESIVDHRRV